mgnify:CR=1 FL=1
MGKNLDDIGHSMANFTRLKWPDLSPELIVDVGCTIGHNTLPWKQTFPEAEVHGLDAASPCLQYGHARAEAMGIPIQFKQALCDALPYSDNSVDVVFSSMFLHELPTELIRAFFKEAHRVLKPGGAAMFALSNRCFPTKAVNIWLKTNDLEHVYVVGSYFHYAGAFKPPSAVVRTVGVGMPRR